jgi:hypothetical protein
MASAPPPMSAWREVREGVDPGAAKAAASVPEARDLSTRPSAASASAAATRRGLESTGHVRRPQGPPEVQDGAVASGPGFLGRAARAQRLKELEQEQERLAAALRSEDSVHHDGRWHNLNESARLWQELMKGNPL